MSLEFPFVPVTDAHIAFGGIPNRDIVLEACPEEFFDPNNSFRVLANKVRYGEIDPENDLKGYVLARDVVIEQKRYLDAWIASYALHDEQKMAVAGWLLSLMLVKESEANSTNE